MDAEIQRRKTFEIIAKWIGKHNGVTITFEPDAVPHADTQKRIITLPSNLKIENLDKVLALIFHEAGHIAHSTFDIKKLVTNSREKDILNAAEDVRVDRQNMDYLPRVSDFYEELVKWEDETTPPENIQRIPKPVRALLDAMRICNGFGKYVKNEPDIAAFMNKHRITDKIETIGYHLSCLEHRGNKMDYDEAKKLVKELTEIIFGKQKGQPQDGQGQGQGTGDKKDGQGSGIPNQCEGKDPTPNGGQGQDGQNSQGQDKGNPSDKDGNQGGFFGLGHPELFQIDPNAHYALDDMSLTEQTVQAFKELLMVKSTRTIIDGTVLNIDNLTAFFTGQVDELFKEIKIEKHKKSKILFLLDSSGSMNSTDGMYDDEYKTHTLVTVGHKLTEILRELKETEGTNVDFDVRGFDTNYHVWDKDEWEQEYIKAPGGGTNCKMAFQQAQEEIMKDNTIDGNKLIIMITDGQVDRGQIDDIKNLMIKNSSDIKCLILGIGLHKEFETVIGGRNIVAKELADGEILNAIEDMLDN